MIQEGFKMRIIIGLGALILNLKIGSLLEKKIYHEMHDAFCQRMHWLLKRKVDNLVVIFIRNLRRPKVMDNLCWNMDFWEADFDIAVMLIEGWAGTNVVCQWFRFYVWGRRDAGMSEIYVKEIQLGMSFVDDWLKIWS